MCILLTRRRALALPLLGATAAAAQVPPQVVASFSILADIARELAGPAALVTAIVGPGQDAHGFEPRPSDLHRVRAADLAVANGLGFDPWMDRLVRASGFSGPFVRAAAAIPPRGADPHAFQDLGNAPAYARAIADALAGLRPGLAPAIAGHCADFLDRAAATDAWVRAEFATVPAERRLVLTSHDAFGWFGAAYGVRFLAAQGLSTDSEPSAAEVARLVRRIRDSGVRVAFLETAGNPRLIRQVARDAGVRLGGTLYSDALGPPGSTAATYLGMFRHNVALMLAAMRG